MTSNLNGICRDCMIKIPHKLKYSMKYKDYWCAKHTGRQFQKRMKSKAIRKQGKDVIKALYF